MTIASGSSRLGSIKWGHDGSWPWVACEDGNKSDGSRATLRLVSRIIGC